jgi:hypothetical protein
MIHVALDLGSESMAAYYDDPHAGVGGMIQLQEPAQALMEADGFNLLDQTIDYLKEKTEKGSARPSPRMWNRIQFRDGAQPREPGVDHAKLEFVGSSNGQYQQSLFKYFHLDDGWPGEGKIVPNPKILFQHQVKRILPANVDARGNSNEKVNVTPEMLVKHLTLQVIINFVLNSRELRYADRKDIHLTITVPNVYSLPHAESLKAFVKENTDVGKVDILSESDAVAYYVLTGRDDRDPPELKTFKEWLRKSLIKRKKLCLITLDIGKGTTDLSCVLVEQPKVAEKHRALGFPFNIIFGSKRGEEVPSPTDRRKRHSVQGKTGKCSGGNYLNYIFARYYDRRLRAAARTLEEATGIKVPFGFIQRASKSDLLEPQRKTVYALEQLIEEIKPSVTEQFGVGLSAERQHELLTAVVNHMFQRYDSDPGDAKYNEFHEQLINALIIPRTLGGGEMLSFFKLLAPRRRDGGSIRPTTSETASLRADLEAYVRENINELFDSLRKLVKEHQAVLGNGQEIDRNTFVVVSGQASQFKPIQHAVKAKCKELQIKTRQLYTMSGVACKEACSRGVISYRKLNMWHLNERELHGTYGCLSYGMDEEEFKPFDMSKIKNGNGTTTISFQNAMEYYIVFTTRSSEEVLKDPPRRNDGQTAFIKTFTDTSEFVMEYDRDNLQLKVNQEELNFVGFGDISSSIYPKVWPEILEPAEQN